MYRRGGVQFRLVGTGRDWDALNTAPSGVAVYVVRDASGNMRELGDVVYVGKTGQEGFKRLSQHIQKQGGEWLGNADRFEIHAVGLGDNEALALEESLIQQYRGPALLNKDLHPFAKALGRPLQTQDVPKTNANFGLFVVY